MPKTKIALMWFRRDLRIENNSALQYLYQKQLPILAIFSYNHLIEKNTGEASKWWLSQALKELEEQLQSSHIPLGIYSNSSTQILKKLSAKYEIQVCAWNRLYSTEEVGEENELKKELHQRKIEYFESKDYLIHEPEKLRSGMGKAYQKFTPFYKSCLKEYSSKQKITLIRKKNKIRLRNEPDSLSIHEILKKTTDKNFLQKFWNPTQKGLKNRLENIEENSKNYAIDRDFPAKDASTKLSAYLHWGQIRPSEVLEYTNQLPEESALSLKSEIFWREFSYHIQCNFPHTQKEALRKNFNDFPWENKETYLERWKAGMTGYPFVDAGMRQLQETGWMHNRVRMVCASFLVKHLLQDWKYGMAYFEGMLVDADAACNSMNWQWAAGCGADAAPYFRIFNPITQSKKFDPKALYIRKFISELKGMDTANIHTPWLDKNYTDSNRENDYPQAIVEHKNARIKALEAYRNLTKVKSTDED